MKTNIIDKLNKLIGKNIASIGSEKEKVEMISTGLNSLDLAIGGGIPKGGITEIKGLESTAKTSLSLYFIAKCQREGMTCAFIDAEYAFNKEHAKSIGVNMEELIMIAPDCAEEVFEVIEALSSNNMAQVIVVDSVSSLVPKPEAEAEVGKQTMGGQARVISQGLRKVINPLRKNGTILIFINQLRMNIMGGSWDPYTSSGGMALKYYTYVSLRLNKKGVYNNNETGKAAGITLKVRVAKNKVGPPFGECEINYDFKEGWTDVEDLLSLGVKTNLIKRNGNTYFYGEANLGVGKEKALESIMKDESIVSSLQNQMSQLHSQ